LKLRVKFEVPESWTALLKKVGAIAEVALSMVRSAKEE